MNNNNRKFSVATNFDNALIDELAKFPVIELYGKLSADVVGGGRSSYLLAPVSKRRLAHHVAYARKRGIGFNYLLNASCLDNLETTRVGQKRIRALLDWISKIEVSAVTVSNPLLLRIIKRCYPALKVRVSVFNGVDHLRKAKYWEELGADVICLDSLTVNREFQTLRELRKGLNCELELLTNNNCLQSCPLSPAHMNLLSHSSQEKHRNGGFVIDHCILECSKLKLLNPVNYVRSDWIRPEDLTHYENLGFSRFKIVERNLPTDVMVRRVRAYSEGRFDGNLIDLIQPYGHSPINGKSQRYNAHGMIRKFSFLFRPTKVNVLRLSPLKKLSAAKGMLRPLSRRPPIYIDNRLLDGFIERFLKLGCRNVDCEKCGYCHSWAKKAVRIETGYQQECLSYHNEIDAALESGSLWRYF